MPVLWADASGDSLACDTEKLVDIVGSKDTQFT